MRLKSNLMESIINNLKEASILDYVDDKEKQSIEDILNSYSSTYNSIKYKYGNEMNATFENGISFYFIKVDGSYEYYVMDDKGNTTKSYPISYGLVDEARNFIPINESEDTESNNNTYYYDIHIVEDDATGMGYSVFIKTTKHYDEDLDADAIVDEAIKQNKLDADEADYCDYVSEISEQEYKDAVPHKVEESLQESKDNKDSEYNYMMLSRLKSDCDYYLGNGNRNPRNLWAGDEARQIAKMREFYDKVPEEPEWLTKEDIDDYEDKMINGSEDSPENHIENPTVIEDKDKLGEAELSEIDKAANQIKSKIDRLNSGKEASFEVEASFKDFPEILSKLNKEDRLKGLMMLYMSNPKPEELNSWDLDKLLSYIEETDEYFNEDKEYIDKCINLINGLDESSLEDSRNNVIKELSSIIKEAGLTYEEVFEDIYTRAGENSELIDIILSNMLEDYKEYLGEAAKIVTKYNLEENTNNLKEDSYEDNIFTDIETALNQYGLDVTRYTEAGMMTKNIGWVVSNSEGEVNLTCDGTYLDESNLNSSKKSKLNEGNWIGKLESGSKLRELIREDGDSTEYYQKVLDAIKDCCNEAIKYLKNYSNTNGDNFDYEINGFTSVIEDIDMIYNDEDLDEGAVDYELEGLYDWCDSARLFLTL